MRLSSVLNPKPLRGGLAARTRADVLEEAPQDPGLGSPGPGAGGTNPDRPGRPGPIRTGGSLGTVPGTEGE